MKPTRRSRTTAAAGAPLAALTLATVAPHRYELTALGALEVSDERE